MQAFVSALKARDVEGLLQCFSRSASFHFTTTNMRDDGAPFNYMQLQKGLMPCGDFVDAIFGDDGDDSLRDYVEHSSTAPWLRTSGMRFVPPGYDAHSLVFVRWRKEGGRYVVAEIGFPGG